MNLPKVRQMSKYEVDYSSLSLYVIVNKDLI